MTTDQNMAGFSCAAHRRYRIGEDQKVLGITPDIVRDWVNCGVSSDVLRKGIVVEYSLRQVRLRPGRLMGGCGQRSCSLDPSKLQSV
jgi:hypothetical protein